ncbi:erythromycin esterase family protein [Kitasatospora sp. NPDC028055]|uniref:erythromycin esterase family protein n=1 Tax=Kitasatospora sp. NPDC028055 TaxID=3155653 RepID=UPI00341161B5
MPNDTAAPRQHADTLPHADTVPLPLPLPLPATELDALAGRLAAGAAVVGLGESTRFSRETFGVREQLFRRLVRDHGFRALAVQDSAGVGQALDAYVRGGVGSAADALAGAWRPGRTEEMAGALKWIRDFNSDHPDDPVRILGVKPVQAGDADYDAVLAYVRTVAPERLAELAAHLEPIRTAHRIDEHVQRARGIHPGRPFAEHARDARALVESLAGADTGASTGAGDAVARVRLIVDFHEHSVAGRGNYAGEAELWAGTIAGFQQRTGLRTVYWDGIAHTAATEATLGVAAERGPQATAGSLLRKRYGAGYVSVAIGFHHGDLGAVVAPAPAADLVDAKLGEPGLPARWLDLRREDVRREWDGPAKARVISGIYTPERDAVEHLAVDSLAEAFDVLVHVRRTSPVHRLP